MNEQVETTPALKVPSNSVVKDSLITDSREQVQEPKLVCEYCGVDRFKSPCPDLSKCTFVGHVQQLASTNEMLKDEQAHIDTVNFVSTKINVSY